MRVTIDTRELKALVRDLRRSRAVVRRVLPREAEDAWEDMTKAAKARAPFRTGRLRDGLETEVTTVGRRVIADTTSEAPYTSAVEYGEHGRPFLRAAFDGQAKRSVRQVEDRVFRELDRVL